jgi:hypothetical protein
MKIEMIVPIVTLILFASGCMSQTESTTTTAAPQTGLSGQQASETTTTQATATTQKPKPIATTTTLKAAGGIGEKISNLAAAMSAGVTMRCKYTYQDTSSQGWMKGDKYYFTTTVKNVDSNVVSDGTWVYVWESGKGDGVKFNVKQMKTLSEGKEQGYQDMNKVASTATNVECVPDIVADGKFTPPATVQFSDMGELLKQMQGYQGKGGLQGMDPQDLPGLPVEP